MSVIFNQYEERLHRLNRQPQTIINYRNSVRPFEQYLRAHRIPAEKVDPVIMEEYFATLDRGPNTKRTHLTQIGAAYRYAQRRGLVPADPTVDVRLERIPDKEPRIIPNDELREQKARLVTDREWTLWHLLAYGGFRRHEITELVGENVKLAEGTITIVGKGGKLRHVPIHPALGEVLAEQKLEAGVPVLHSGRNYSVIRPTSNKTFYRILADITEGRYAGHDYRRTVASSLYKNGVATDTIDKIMGWSPRVVRTRYYQNIADEQLQRAILKLYADDPI